MFYNFILPAITWFLPRMVWL